MTKTSNRSGAALVFAQFALLALILWPRTAFQLSPGAILLLAVAVLLGSWTLVHNRPGNFNVRPEPKGDGRLVTTGPYRHVRHPMYAALLLFAAAVVLAYADPWKSAALALLFAVLWKKSDLEEGYLRARYPQYAAYAARVRRFLPGLL